MPEDDVLTDPPHYPAGFGWWKDRVHWAPGRTAPGARFPCCEHCRHLELMWHPTPCGQC